MILLPIWNGMHLLKTLGGGLQSAAQLYCMWTISVLLAQNGINSRMI